MTFRVAAVAVGFSLLGAIHSAAQTDAADKILNETRTALGGSKLATIKSLSFSGTSERLSPPGSQTVDMEFSLQLPDKFLREGTPVSAHPIGGGSPVSPPVQLQCINGTTGWSFVMFPPGTLLNGGAPPDTATDMDETRKKAAIRDFNRYLIAFLLSSSPNFPVTFTSAGETDTPNGAADTIDGKGPDDFSIRLLIDKKTKRPVAISYTNGAQLALADYRAEGGVLLPHQLTSMMAGNPVERLQIKTFKINPKFSAKKFNKP
jgi:hypothetical protein